MIEQIKGIYFSVDSLLGRNSTSPLLNDEKNNQLFQMVIYLSPGDYHRFHSPANWSVQETNHFTGQLFSVSPKMVRMIDDIFVLNERVSILGKWNDNNFFSMTAVGATNVGSVKLSFDQVILI